MNLFIKKKHIKYALGVTQYKASLIFYEYSNILANEKLKKIDPSSLPKSWFINEYSKRTGLSKKDLEEAFERSNHDSN